MGTRQKLICKRQSESWEKNSNVNRPAITNTQFEQYLCKASSLAKDAVSYFELFYFLLSPGQRKKYGRVFEKHHRILNFIKRAALDDLVLSLHKLLEDAKNPVSIYRCISMALQLSLISRDEKRALTKLANEVKPIWQKVGVLRDQLVAHRDSSIPVESIFNETKVSPKELRCLALTYGRILDVLIRAYGKNSFDLRNYSDGVWKEIEAMMDDLLI
jgi:AbiU2